MEWNLNELRKEVTRSQGKVASFKLSSFLNSICERQEFARYHFHEARDSLSQYMDDSIPEMELFRLAFSGKGETREDFSERKFKARANVLACVQSTHAVSDILAHAIYYALNLDCAKTERDITIASVIRWLQTRSEYTVLCGLLNELVSHDDYGYMCALANHSKHRSIVSLGLNFNFRKAGNEMKELVFPDFSYGGKQYSKRMVFEFLESECDRQNRSIVSIGNVINALAKEMR